MTTVAGVFCGFTKPEHVEGFLRPHVDEVNKLQSSGLRFGNKTVGVKLHMSDLPARCFAKATISYVGKHSCHKCTCMGVHEGKNVIVEDVDAELRTEESFKGRTDKEHHKSWKSPRCVRQVLDQPPALEREARNKRPDDFVASEE